MNQGAKKVLFLITKATWGGAQRYVFDLATHLPKDRFEGSVAYGTAGRLVTMLREKNVRAHTVPSLGRDVALLSDIMSFFLLLKLLRAERPDVLHVNSSKAAALGVLAGRLCGVKRIIFTAHGWPFKEDRNPIARALIYFISWLTALFSHATIVVSKRDEEIGKRMWLVGKKIHYIPLGIETPTFLPREEAAAALSISTNTPRIVTIAELIENKGIGYAIDAIADLKRRIVNVEYFIIGDSELRTELSERARELNVADRVRFLGFVENASQYLKAFDIFLLPSIKEGTPYVLLEAAAAGLPIVATDVVKAEASNIPNIYFVPPADPRALANAVEKLARNMPSKNPSTVGSFMDMLEKTTALY